MVMSVRGLPSFRCDWNGTIPTLLEALHSWLLRFLADNCGHVFLWWCFYLRWDVECFILQHCCYPPRQRKREREHRKNDNLYFQNHNLLRTTADNKPKQNQTTDSPSSLLAYWEILRISAQIITLASMRPFFLSLKEFRLFLDYAVIVETCLLFFPWARLLLSADLW